LIAALEAGVAAAVDAGLVLVLDAVVAGRARVTVAAAIDPLFVAVL
jgi:hypothetical protein